jgi:hypothetical protein
MDNINWLAVAVAGLSAFLVGGLWYAPPLFGNAWMKENQLSDEQIQKGNKAKIFGFTFVFSVLMAWNLSLFLQNSDAGHGAAVGFHAGIWTFCAIAIHSLFELKSWKLIFINGGYSIVSLTLMGTIIGAWH